MNPPGVKALQGLAAEQPLKVPDALFEPPDLRASDHRLIRSHGRCSALAHLPAPTIKQVGRYAASAATEDTVSPGRKLSSMIGSFCSVAQCRRRAVPVISSMRRELAPVSTGHSA